MSSFIVEDKTINRIVNFCYWEHDSFLKFTIEKELKNIGIDLKKYTDDLRTDKKLKSFGEELLKLNCLAVYDRYKESSGFNIEEEIKKAIKNYKYEDLKKEEFGEIQVLKSIACFLYQCNEGEFNKNPLYTAIEEIRRSLESHIINKMPEYDKAYWG